MINGSLESTKKKRQELQTPDRNPSIGTAPHDKAAFTPQPGTRIGNGELLF